MNTGNIITLMFHRVEDAALGLHAHVFARYLAYLVHEYKIVVPGDTVPAGDTALCLTFDDAYYDFYHYVFPLLQQYQIKAVLAVPLKYIVAATTVAADRRLSVGYYAAMQQPSSAANVPFCTWAELKVMAQSQLVEMASHSINHTDLSDPNADLAYEIIESKNILEQELNSPIKCFVYPYGRFSTKARNLVAQHYQFNFRIGHALNKGWGRPDDFMYRLTADPFWTQQKRLSRFLTHKLNLQYYLNRLRNK